MSPAPLSIMTHDELPSLDIMPLVTSSPAAAPHRWELQDALSPSTTPTNNPALAKYMSIAWRPRMLSSDPPLVRRLTSDVDPLASWDATARRTPSDASVDFLSSASSFDPPMVDIDADVDQSVAAMLSESFNPPTAVQGTDVDGIVDFSAMPAFWSAPYAQDSDAESSTPSFGRNLSLSTTDLNSSPADSSASAAFMRPVSPFSVQKLMHTQADEDTVVIDRDDGQARQIPTPYQQAPQNTKRSRARVKNSAAASPPLSATSSLAMLNLHVPARERRCENCHGPTTSSWRRGGVNGDMLLCNACGIYWRDHLAHRPLNSDGVVVRLPRGSRQLQPVSSVPGYVCARCNTTNTSLWRRGPRNTRYCNNCGLALLEELKRTRPARKAGKLRKARRGSGSSSFTGSDSHDEVEDDEDDVSGSSFSGSGDDDRDENALLQQL